MGLDVKRAAAARPTALLSCPATGSSRCWFGNDEKITMANIAIVSSTEFGGSNQACFEAGLASCLGGKSKPTILGSFQSKGNYDVTVLREWIRTAVKNNPRPDLIVAAGGLEMAQAAASELQEQDPKFIYLSNDALEGNPAAFAGGVNLNAPGADHARKTLLKKTYSSVQDASMYLVVNNNSPMSPNDAKDWPSDRVARFFDGVANPLRKAGDQFKVEFAKLAQRRPAPTGLVISADPHFFYWRTAFTNAVAEKLPVPVCYPFQDFVDTATGNKDNSIALDNPPLNNSSDASDQTTAYFQLGKQVGRFISGIADVGVLTWDGSEWKLPPPGLTLQTKPLMEIEIRVKGRVDETALQEVLAALRRFR
jgi:hypothetical protein